MSTAAQRRIEWSLLLLLYSGMVFVSVTYATAKWQALRCHARDFAFYAQFQAKVLDPNLSNRYSVNTVGNNFLEFQGIDGGKNFYRTVHCEPIKFLQAVVYRLFPTPAAAFAFTAIVYFLPLLYLWVCAPRPGSLDRLFLWFIIGTYCLYSSVQEAVSWDLRPYVFLAPCLWLAFLALHQKRPLYEAVAFFIVLLATREESLFFGTAVVCYVLAGQHQTDNYYRRITPRLATVLLSACVLYALYFAWIAPDYTYTALTVLSRSVMWFGFIGSSLTASAWLHSTLVRRHATQRTLALFQAAMLLLIFVPLGFQFYAFNGGMPLYEMRELFLADPRQSLHVACVLLAALVGWQLLQRPRYRHVMLGCTAVLFLYITLQNFQESFGPTASAYRNYRRYKQEQPEAELVFVARRQLDKYHTAVLCDYRTYQAFYDFDNVFILQGLPEYLVHGKTKEQVQALLVRLLQRQIEYIVIRTSSQKALMELINAARMQSNVHLYKSNKHFLVYRARHN